MRALGVLRYQRQGAYWDAGLLARFALPMAAGSIVGAAFGAALLPYAPGAAVKLLLGIVLAVSAVKPSRKH